MICMFGEDFFNNLLQPPKDNLWQAHLTNRNYRIRLLRQFVYLSRFVFEKIFPRDQNQQKVVREPKQLKGRQIRITNT